MKKLLYSILALAGVTMASCTQEHVEVQYVPGNVVAPILGDIGDLQLKEGNSDITIDYVKADFGLPAVSADVLYVSVSEDMSSKRRVNAKFEDGVITVTNLDLNTAINNAGATPEEATQAYFAIISSLVTDKGAIISSSEVMSNIVSANVTPFLSEIIPSLKYGKMYVVGSFNNWDHVAVEQNFDFLYDYEGNGQFSGVIDFRAPGAIEFKLTAGAWGVEEHSASGPHDAEASTITLVAGGGSNINVWGAKRFYGATFDKSGPTLKKSWSADQIGIVGGFTNWADGADVVMEWNPKWGRFYADIELSADTELKFRADGAWDLNWGAGCAVGGDNIAVAAGNYRVYFNPMIGFIEFNTMQYGKEEDITGGNTGGGGNEEPEPEELIFGLVGTPNSWGETPDTVLEVHNGNWVVAKDYTVTAEDQFKIRANNDPNWTVNYGGPGDTEPFGLTAGTTYTLVSGGKNMSVADGSYDVYFNISTFEFVIVAAGAADPTIPSDAKAVKLYAHKEGTAWAEMALYCWDGYDVGAWPGLLLTEKETIDGKEFFVYEFPESAYGLTTNIIFNNNNNGEQTQDITGVVLNRDYYYIIPAEGDQGKYLAYEMGTEPVKPTFPVLEEHSWGVMGSFNEWAADVPMEIVNGVATATIEFANASGEFKFKVRADGAWADNFGYNGTDMIPVDGTEFEATYNGSDIVVAEAGKYEVSLRIADEKGYMKVTKL